MLRGLTPYERIGQDACSFLHPDDASGAVETLRRSAADVASNVLLDVRVRRRDGTFIWVETSARNMLDDPSVRGIVVNFREVTQRRALQDELVHTDFHDSPTALANRAPLNTGRATCGDRVCQ